MCSGCRVVARTVSVCTCSLLPGLFLGDPEILRVAVPLTSIEALLRMKTDNLDADTLLRQRSQRKRRPGRKGRKAKPQTRTIGCLGYRNE